MSSKFSMLLIIEKLLLFLSCWIFIDVVNALDNGLAKTPPMGWLSWERFKCEINCDRSETKNGKLMTNCISENLFKQIADTLIERGYQKVGYDRINLDDCWSTKSREVHTGNLLPDPIRFPNGIKYLSDYMHKNGFKIGIYQNYGSQTCMGYPGILGHMDKDLKKFAEWQVDMIKLDACFTRVSKLDNGYLEFRRSVDRIFKKPIILSCSWPYYQIWTSHKQHIIPKWDLISLNCNLFRVFHDITPNWHLIQMVIDFMGDYQEIFRRITGPGSWPDPDMLMIGNPGLSVNQAEAQMAIWCIIPAPLLMSNDPRDMEPEFENILLNIEAIGINQDKLALPGERIFHNNTMDIWRRSLSKNQMAIVILNRNMDTKLNVNIPLEQILIDKIKNFENDLNVLNIFTSKKILLKNDQKFLNVTVEPTGVVFLKFTPI